MLFHAAYECELNYIWSKDKGAAAAYLNLLKRLAVNGEGIRFRNVRIFNLAPLDVY